MSAEVIRNGIPLPVVGEMPPADDLEPGSRTLAGTSLVTPLIYSLLVLLLLEQAVAYSASYHMPRRGGSAEAGGRRRASAG